MTEVAVPQLSAHLIHLLQPFPKHHLVNKAFLTILFRTAPPIPQVTVLSILLFYFFLLHNTYHQLGILHVVFYVLIGLFSVNLWQF